MPLALFSAASLPSCQNPIAQKAEALQAKAVSPILTLSSTGGAALASGSSLDFGLISIGSSCDIVLDIANSGPSSLVIDLSKISIVPDASTKAGAFALSNPPPAEIASGGSASLKLSFSPDSAGAKMATINIPTNDVETPVYSIAMKGTGWAVVLATSAATNIAQTTATSGGNITDDGGWSIVDRGIAWGTSQNPTLAASKASDGGSGTGLYSCLMTNLTPGTLYYVRAYASNSLSTGYGSQVSFATLPAAPTSVNASAVPYPAGKKQLSVSWASANGTAAYYDVYYGATAAFSSATLGLSNLTGSSCVLDNLAEYAPYYIWVVAKNASGTSAPSTTMATPVSTGIRVTGVSLNQASLVLGASVKQLVCTIIPDNASNPNVSWSISSGSAYASVDTSGLVSRISSGAATVTVTTADQGKTASCAVTVAPLIWTMASGFDHPEGLAVDSSGNVYVADYTNCRIVKIDSAGNATTFAGKKGLPATSGSILSNDNGNPATSVKLRYPQGVAVDGSGNVYIVDNGLNCIRKVDTSGNIWVIAGTGAGTYTGDNGPATAATLYNPMSVAVNSAGTIVYIADMSNNRVRRISGGTITTIVGTGTSGCGADGIAGTSSALSYPTGVATNGDGSILYIVDNGNQRIRKWTSSDSKVTTVAGTGVTGFSGDGGLATAAKLYIPHSVATDSGGTVLFIADSGNSRVRKVVTSSGIISTYAGSASTGYTGDGGIATDATLGYLLTGTYPTASVTYFFGVACDPSGTGKVYIGDTVNNCVRAVY